MARNLQSGTQAARRLVGCFESTRQTVDGTHGGFMKSILDPTFHYTPSASTDLRKTFARVRREMRKHDRVKAETSAKVSPIFERQVRAVASR